MIIQKKLQLNWFGIGSSSSSGCTNRTAWHSSTNYYLVFFPERNRHFIILCSCFYFLIVSRQWMINVCFSENRINFTLKREIALRFHRTTKSSPNNCSISIKSCFRRQIYIVFFFSLGSLCAQAQNVCFSLLAYIFPFYSRYFVPLPHRNMLSDFYSCIYSEISLTMRL